ncbi:MAG: helix-turn-helix domain-containing protein [Ruminococcus sp.]|nr:helix-turn-helix domain-containing protein [Ruminococcus sp.]
MSTDNKRVAVTHENLFAKGYGIIPQAVMFDITLSVKSKALYAYFCSYCGSGHSVYPSRDTILSDIGLSKDAYYSALNPLTEAGYITVAKAKGYINKNTYVISNTPKYVNHTLAVTDDSEESTLSFEGINANGFGIIPKMVMCDKELNITAKALLALFYSLAATGACVFPKRGLILSSLSISKTTYYKALDLIIERGYVKVKTRRSKNGRFAINNYILVENPQPCPKNQDNESVRVLKSRTLPCPKNQDNNNIIFNNNTHITTSNLITSTTTTQKQTDEIREDIQRLTDYDEYEEIVCKVEQKLDRSINRNAYEYSKMYLRIVNIICDMATSSKLFVGDNQAIPKENFWNALMSSLHRGSLHYLIDEIVEHYIIIKQKYHLRNPKAYLKKVIWQHIENFDLSSDWWCEEM